MVRNLMARHLMVRHVITAPFNGAQFNGAPFNPRTCPAAEVEGVAAPGGRGALRLGRRVHRPLLRRAGGRGMGTATLLRTFADASPASFGPVGVCRTLDSGPLLL